MSYPLTKGDSLMSLSYQYKVVILVGFILIFCFSVIGFKIRVTSYAPPEFLDIQRVEVLQFFSLQANKPNTYLDAYYLEIKKNFTQFDFINPHGYFLGKNAEADATHFTSQRLDFDKLKSMSNFKGDIKIKRGPMEVDCQQGTYWTDSEQFFCKERVKVFAKQQKTRDEVTINSDEVKAFFQQRYSIHKSHVFGMIKRPFLHEPSTDFSTDSLSFYYDQGQAHLDGNVHVIHGEYDVKSRRGEILIENYNKKLKYFTFDDDVVIEQKSKKIPGGKRIAYAEKVESVRSEGTVILTGAPRVIQGRDNVKGNKITVREGASLVEVDDAASNIIYEQKQAK